MAAPTAGALILVPFPFSDLSQAKLRPAVVLAAVGRGDWILCQMTSNPYGDPHALRLTDRDLHSGMLRATGYARPGKLFTAHRDLIVAEIAVLQVRPFAELVQIVMDLLSDGQAAHARGLRR